MKPGDIIIRISLIIVLLFILHHKRQEQKPTESQSTPSQTAQFTQPTIGKRTKTDGCVERGPLPDPGCTPGGVIEGVTKEQICVLGYSKAVRNVLVEMKDEVYREYGVTSHKPGQYEVDHLISLELGGSNDISNLWPEAANPRPGYHEKDRVENYLHKQVCKGKVSIEEAQRQIATNWLVVFKKLPKTTRHRNK